MILYFCSYLLFFTKDIKWYHKSVLQERLFEESTQRYVTSLQHIIIKFLYCRMYKSCVECKSAKNEYEWFIVHMCIYIYNLMIHLVAVICVVIIKTWLYFYSSSRYFIGTPTIFFLVISLHATWHFTTITRDYSLEKMHSLLDYFTQREINEIRNEMK